MSTATYNPHRTFIIAEAGVNHNGDLALAERLIDAAAEAGADAVKFQTFSAANLASAQADMATYQKRNTQREERQVDMLARLELKRDIHFALQARCIQKGIAFMSSPFDVESLRFLCRDLGLSTIKVPSGEIVNGPYLLEVAREAESIILSTGMAEMAEIAQALDVLAWGWMGFGTPRNGAEVLGAAQTDKGRAVLSGRLTLLHCTSEYPAAADTVNLRAMATLAEAFGLPVGFSDHSEGIAIPIAASAMGAVVIEKHMTLDRDLPGPDHKASLEPAPFADMVAGIRTVEAALGTGEKVPFPVELETRKVARKSLVAARAIGLGDNFTEDNLAIKRPGTGLSPMRYWSLLETQATQSYVPGDLIAEDEE